MKSYNCFYSALYDSLEKYYEDKTYLILNNRWQFFFRQGNCYSDDKRIIGEWPLLYDALHLTKLQENLGIKVSIIKKMNCSKKEFLYSYESNPKMIFVNKINLLYNSSLRQENKCVSTIIAQKKSDTTFYCYTYDNELPSFVRVGSNVLYSAWVKASDYEQLNECFVLIKLLKTKKTAHLENFAKECMQHSIINYLTPKNDENIYWGNSGIKKFSTEILNWDKDFNKKSIDCSMYIDILVKQRICFIYTLEKLSIKNKKSILEELHLLMEKWNKLKLLLFILGSRGQRGSILKLSRNINELGEFEFKVMYKILRNIL